MSKYSSEFKLKVVNFYLNNHNSWKYVAKQFDIPARRTVRKRVRKYEIHEAKRLLKMCIKLLKMYIKFIIEINKYKCYNTIR